MSWPADAAATSYTVYRKNRDDSSWGTGIALSLNATNYTDTNVVVGGAYEYWVSKITPTYYGQGYLYSGIQAPLVENRGKMVLLVDQSTSASLASELTRLAQDLVGDGWVVIRHDVPRMSVDPADTSTTIWAARSNELAAAKALVLADYQADPGNVVGVLLFGHVPVPYSGNLAPDGHADHLGAWPADAYYGDMTGTWGDTDISSTGASDPRNYNVPGDGKLDPIGLPAKIMLQVGRVDMANLPAFLQSEIELLRRYLNKDHAFRFGSARASRRGLIADNLGVSAGEPFAVNGWRNFAPFFTSTSIVATADWFGTLLENDFLWGYGCGPGTYTSIGGIGSTTDFAEQDPKVVFTMFFGSYLGDWDSQNNFLRSAIATPTYTLTAAWAGRPNWVFHHMALGETVGFSTRVTQNNTGSTYAPNRYQNWVHIALMGDPTLRMHVVMPASALAVVTNNAGGVNLNWTASPDTVLGYHVYSAPTMAGPFTRLTTGLVAGTSYTDPAGSANVYMVRAVKLEVSGSGSYYNASQGIFQSLDGSAGAPQIQLYQPTNNAVFIAPATILLKADTFDPANCNANVSFYANGQKLGDAPGPFYNLTWSNAPAGQYALVAQANCTSGLVTNSSPVSLSVVGLSPILTITSLGSGSLTITGTGIPGLTYHIQSCSDLNITNWQTAGTGTGSPSGTFQIILTPGATSQFYRSVYP